MRSCEPVALNKAAITLDLLVGESSFHVNTKGLLSMGQAENVATTFTNAASSRKMESTGGKKVSIGAGDPFFSTLKITSLL
jgi:hypothetical protein